MRQVDWQVWSLSVILLLSTVAFGAYYYYDRYGHADQAVIAHQIQNVEAKVKENPQNPDLRVAVANYYFESGLLDQAMQQIQQALTIDPNHQGALILLASVYQKTGKLDQSIEHFNRVLELNKDNPLAKIDPRLEMVNYELGTMYNQQGKYAQAVTALKNALEISPTDTDAHYILGLVYQNQSDYTNATTEFKEALRFIPDFVEAYENLALCYTAMGKAAEARYARAMILLLQGQTAQAAAQLQELVAQTPDLREAYFGLGLANEKLGRREEAIRALSEFIKTHPNDIAAQQALGRVSKGN